jgi:hypothetical protein
VDSTVLTVRTGDREVVHDLTGSAGLRTRSRRRAAARLRAARHRRGGRARARRGSDDDLLAALADLLPADDRWRHRHGSRGHGRSHVLPALVPPYATLPVLDGVLELGTWQSVALVDLNLDNPERTVRLSFLPG